MSNSESHCDALIVGAGPVGLTMALELARHGLSCRIIDRCAAPTDKSKALVMWGRTLELFDQSGLAEDFVGAGMWANGASIYGNSTRLVQVHIHREDTAFPRPLMIPQNETERLLNLHLERLGMQVERETELVTLEQIDGNGPKPAGGIGQNIVATVRQADGRQEIISCSWLLGCDGAHSTVRKQLGIEFTGEFEPNDWILADVHIDRSIPSDELSLFWHRDGILAFFPIGPSRFRVIGDLGKAPGAEKPADPTLSDVQAMIDRRGPAGVVLRDPVWLSGFRIHERKVAEYGRGRAFLAGDAAHIHSPAGGQGMNTGMQDAFNLAWKLALVHRGGAKPSLLASYTHERSAVGEMVLRNAGFMTRMATLRNPVLQFVRNHVMTLAGKLTAIQERAIAALTEMAVHYPNSSLNSDDPGSAWKGELKPGDRLPDAQVHDARSCKSVRLLEALRGTTHTLLLMPAEGNVNSDMTLANEAREVIGEFEPLVRSVLITPAGTDDSMLMGRDLRDEHLVDVETALIDDSGQVRTRLGLHGTAIALVRPDGYVGFRGHRESWSKLSEHLQSYLTTAGSISRANTLDSRAAQLV